MRDFISCFAFLLVCLPALGADSDAGRQKAQMCAGCHGSAGISSHPEWPNLAGQKRLYLQAQLHKFRDGERTSAAMNGVARTLSDADIENLAEYFAGLPQP